MAQSLPRGFKAWAKRTYGWERGDFARLQRDKPLVLAGIVAYWQAKRSNPNKPITFTIPNPCN